MTKAAAVPDRRIALLQSIANIQADPLFVLDSEGNYLDCIGGNDRALYDDPSFLVGLNIKNVLPAALVEQVLDAVHRALETESLVVVEYALGNAEVEGSRREGPGDAQWFEGRIVPLDWKNTGNRCVAWLAINISERKRAEAALCESEVRLRELSEVLLTAERLAKVWSWEWDIAADRWTTLGRRRGVLDLAPHLASSGGLENFVHPDDLPAFRDTLAKATEGVPCDFQHRFVEPETGETRHVRSFGTVIRDAAGAPVKLRGATQDITDQRRAEEQARHAENLRMTGQLAAGFAHEFNNLLQVVVGSIEIARLRPGTDAKLARVFDAVAEAIRRGKELTRNLLSFSRQQDLAPTTIDPAELIGQTVDMLAPALGEKIRLEMALADGLPLITVDTTGLETALLNIALNAVAAMPDGGTLTVRASQTHLDGIREPGSEPLTPGEYLEIELADTGCGMSEEILAQAFEPFFTTREVGEGTGLGLSTVLGFVRQSNGALTLESREGEGTTARILLPVAAGNVDITTPLRYATRRANGRTTAAGKSLDA